MDLSEIYSRSKNKKLSRDNTSLYEKLDLRFSNSLETKRATFNGNSVCSRDICLMLRRSPFLEDVSLVSIDDIVPVLRQMCRSNKHIESLTLRNCSSAESTVPEEALKNILLSLPVLKSINLKQTKIKSEEFYTVLASKSNITSLDLGMNEFITYRDLLTIVHNSGLTELKMSRRHKNLNISDLEMAYLVKCLKPKITLLHLDMSGLGNHTYTEIFQCTGLEDLKLNYAMNLTSELLSLVPNSLKKIHCLKIEGPTMLGDNDLCKHLFSDEGFSQQLTNLKLENFDSMQDEECQKILAACVKLNVLSLKGCKSLTVRGITRGLIGMLNLSQLNLGFLGCSDGIKEISKLPQLNELIVDHRTYAINNLINMEKNHLRLKIIKF